MSNSDRNLPAAISAIPGPLGIIAFLVFLGLIGLGSRQAGGPPGQSDKAPTPTAAGASAGNLDARFAPLRLLLDYLDNQPPESSKTAEAAATFAVQSELRLANEILAAGLSLDLHAGAGEPKEDPQIAQFHRELSKLLLRRRDLQLECLIALVPDPIDSHFPLMFDNALASIHKGFEAHGFVRDRYVLLWQEAVADGASKSKSAGGNWQKQPSAVLFRKTRDPIKSQASDVNQLVLLLLVGETPTTGVHKQALQAALDFVAAYELARASESGDRTVQIHVLGPEFSGSASSLRLALCNWWDDRRDAVFALSPSDGTCDRHATPKNVRIEVLSGSATADKNDKILNFDRKELTVHFQATVLPDGPATDAVLDYLNKRRIPDQRIAFLTEATSYGEASYGRERKDVRIFRFPISLSRMRSEYEKSEASRESPQSTGPRPASVRRNLDLDSESTRHTIDAIPTFSNATPATSDLSLEHVLATIKRDGIQAVGIMATDVQDVLFLAKQIRMHTPDVLLFTFESEILYTHADHTPYLEGMLVASTYPLFTRNRTWSHQPRLESNFPQGTSHGVFNATIVQLNRLLKDNDRDKELLDYAIPFTDRQHQNSRPPLWLTMVADTGFWPLATIPDAEQDRAAFIAKYTYPPAILADGENLANAENEPWPSSNNNPTYIARPSLSPLLTISAFGLIFAGLIGLHNFTKRSRARNKNSPAPWLERACRWMSLRKLSDSDAPEPVVPMRCFAAATFLVGLLFLLLSLASPVWVWWISQCSNDTPMNGIDWAVVPLALATSLLALATVIVVLVLVLWSWGGSLKHSGMLVLWLVIAGLLFLLLGWWLPVASTDVSKAIFIERVGELGSGVSPLVPLTCVIGVIMLWAACHWRREYFCEVYELANPLGPHSNDKGGSTASHLAGIQSRFDHLDQRLKSPFWLPTEPMDWVFSLLFAVNLGYIAVHWISTAEGIWFDCLFGLATLLAAACFLNLYLHLKAVCGLFERLLRRLGQHAMVPAYRRVPQRLRDKVAGQIFSAAPHAGDLDQAIRCLHHLAAHAATLPGGEFKTEQLRAEVADIQQKFASAQDLDRSKKEFVLAEAAELNRRLAELAGEHLVPRLLSYWDEKPVIEPKQSKNESGDNSESGDNTSQEARQRLWFEEAETFVAIQAVHLIRQVFTHIQNLLTFFVLMLLWLLVCSESYPFVPHRLIQLSTTWLVIWVFVAIVIFMVKFNRNEILSRINNTTPNRFTLDRSFMLTLITYVLIPAVGVLAVQFPPLGRILFGWLNNIRQLSGM